MSFLEMSDDVDIAFTLQLLEIFEFLSVTRRHAFHDASEILIFDT